MNRNLVCHSSASCGARLNALIASTINTNTSNLHQCNRNLPPNSSDAGSHLTSRFKISNTRYPVLTAMVEPQRSLQAA